MVSQPSFWENPTEAKKQMRELDEVKDQLSLIDKWESYISDAQASLELYSLDPEIELIIEANKGLIL